MLSREDETTKAPLENLRVDIYKYYYKGQRSSITHTCLNVIGDKTPLTHNNDSKK